MQAKEHSSSQREIKVVRLPWATFFQKIPILTSTLPHSETPLLVEGQNMCDMTTWTGFWPDVFVPRVIGYSAFFDYLCLMMVGFNRGRPELLRSFGRQTSAGIKYGDSEININPLTFCHSVNVPNKIQRNTIS
jgi:hypothetical protein